MRQLTTEEKAIVKKLVDLKRASTLEQLCTTSLLHESFHVLPSGNYTFSAVDCQRWFPRSSVYSVLNTSFLPNQASSIRLFCALHIHDGVNTSAMSCERALCMSRLLRTRGIMMWPLSPVMRYGRIGEPY